MADVSKIAGYNIKDATARAKHTYTLASGSSNFNFDAFVEKNGIVTFTGEIKAIASANTWVELGTVNNAIKPAYAVVGSFCDAFGHTGVVQVSIEGKVRAFAPVTFNGGYAMINMSWVI